MPHWLCMLLFGLKAHVLSGSNVHALPGLKEQIHARWWLGLHQLLELGFDQAEAFAHLIVTQHWLMASVMVIAIQWLELFQHIQSTELRYAKGQLFAHL